jgi:hypothetical protein
VHRPSSGNSEVQNSLDCARFDNQSEHIREVDAGALTEASDHLARLVALECTIEAQLELEHPFPVMTLARRGHETRSQVWFRCRASNSSFIATRHYGSRRAARTEVGTGESVGIEAEHA